MIRILVLAFLSVAIPGWPADNALTSAEAAAGWTLMFDGTTLNGWRDPAKLAPPGDAWSVDHGTIHAKPSPSIREDLFSQAEYADFEMKFDWKIALGGNSGVKYRIQDFLVLEETKMRKGMRFEDFVASEMAHPSSRKTLTRNSPAQIYVFGFEYQMIDDERHPDARRGNTHVTGSLYDMEPPLSHPGRPAGEWNQSSLLVKGDHVEHWLNGVKVLDGSLTDPAVAQAVRKRWSGSQKIQDLLIRRPKKATPVSLQNHNDEVWFKNLKIHRLP